MFKLITIIFLTLLSNSVWAYQGEVPHRAYTLRGKVHYVYSDHTEIRSGGSLAWRSNNPGNLRWSKSEIGRSGDVVGECIFPDYYTGKFELVALVLRKYSKYTIPQMMEQYAPRSENSTSQYTKNLLKVTRISKYKVIHDMTDTELNRLLNAIEQYEGWVVGKVEIVK